jgi:hypothetical protein
MFVSRKNLALIHLIAGEMLPSGVHMFQALHQRPKCRSTARPRGVLLEPLAKSGIQRRALRFRYGPRLFDQGFVSAEGNVFH